MKAKKSARPSRSARNVAGSAPARQLKHLQATAQQLRVRLAREVEKQKLGSRLLDESKRARAEVGRQVAMLREQGGKAAAGLKKALTDSERLRKARDQALAQLSGLKQELARKTDELKRIAREAAQRAREKMQAAQPEREPSGATGPATGEAMEAKTETAPDEQSV